MTSGGIMHLKRHLSKKMNLLNQKSSAGDKVHDMVLEGWVEELLRFLALKTLAGDITKPFQMTPSTPIAEAWKDLMVMPVTYAEVCYAMGNKHVIDHDPFDMAKSDDELESKRQLKRFNATLRAYQQLFDQQPPRLFWCDPLDDKSYITQWMDTSSRLFSCAQYDSNEQETAIVPMPR